MRRFLVLLLVLGMGVVLGRTLDGVTSTAEAGGDQGSSGAPSPPTFPGSIEGSILLCSS